MDKRPTLSIGRKAKHKGKLQNPISDLKPARSSHAYGDANFEPVVKKNQPLRRTTSSFWEDEEGNDYAEKMLGEKTESIHSAAFLAQSTTPEQILASRISAAGPDVAAAFMKYAGKAKALGGVDPTGFSTSTNAAEKLAYMGHQGQVDIQRTASAMRYRDKQWGTPTAEGEFEEDFSAKLQAVKSVSRRNIQDPTQRMMSVVGAMTISDQSWKQQVDAPDLITPDTNNKWMDPLQKTAQAFGQLANAYIDPDRVEGGEFGAGYASLHARITKALVRQVPRRIANVGFEKATKGPGGTPIGWTQAMPSLQSVAKMIPVSDRMFLTTKINKMWTDVDGRMESPFTEAINTIRETYRSGNEGGLAPTKNFEHREGRYLMDEMVASGLVDPTQTVLSQNPGRDEMYDFRVTNDASELMSEAMQALGASAADLVGDPVLRNEVKKAAAEIAATGSASAATATAGNLTPKSSLAVKSPIPFQLEPFKAMPAGKGGRATTAKRNDPAPAQAPRAGDVIQTAAEAQSSARLATGDPEAARQKYFAERPWLRAVASDDDKSDPMSAWQRHRRGKVTSSAATGIIDPETRKGAMHALVKGALTPLSTPAEIGRGSIWTQSGDALEPVALDWYRKNIDPDAFEPGLIVNRNKAGQATTPDAIAQGGSRNVEVKSRNKFIDPNNPLDAQEAKTLRKNYAQMQHQMYLTGAASTDLVEILRDPENPNAPLGKAGLNESNIRRRTVSRDDEMIRRMRPQWETAGKAADQISGLGSSAQKMFAKAVEEGNISSFEKLSKRYGIEGHEALGATLGLGAGEGKPGKGAGGSGGKGGGRHSFGGFGGRDAPTTFRGGMRGGLAMAGAPGAMLNAALSGVEIAWNTGVDLNDTGLRLSSDARSVGMRENTFRQARMSMQRGRYLNEQDAISDIGSINLAKGGLEQGFTDRAVGLVESTRGAITLGDIQGLNLNDPDAVRGLMGQTEQRLRNRGVSEFGIAATMEQSGLKGLLSATDAEGGRMELNNAVTGIRDTILEFKLEAGAALGDIAGFGTEYFQSMTDSLNKLVEYTAPKQAPGTGNTVIERSVRRVKQDWDQIEGWAGDAADAVTGLYPTSDASSSDLYNEIMSYTGMEGRGQPNGKNRLTIEKYLGMMSADQRASAMNAIRGDRSENTRMQDDIRAGGRLQVELTTSGVVLKTFDNEGNLSSRAYKPYDKQEVE